ncbi:MAG: GntR family carbon starvation induced transcriptional regulator [Paracoccaceae bacterium]
MVSVTSDSPGKPDGVAGTLASSVYDMMRQDILKGDLPPGEKLRVEYLRDRYGVGASPIREALNRLSVDGVVMRVDQKGFRVAEVSVAELDELIKTRCWLEETAIRESIAAGDDAWEERLVLAFHRLSKTPRSADQVTYAINPDWEVLHRAFHLALIGACGSRWLISYCEQLNDLADRYRQLAVRVTYPGRNELDEHKAIMDAAVNRNADGAVDVLMDHYRRTADIIRDSVDQIS